MASLIVFNLPKTVTKLDLREIFSQKGNVTNVQLIFTVDKQYCYFALISFRNEEEALAALNHFDKSTVYSSCISVEQCHEIGNENKETITVEPIVTNQNTVPLDKPSHTKSTSYEQGKWSATNPTGKNVNTKLFSTQIINEVICQNNKSDILNNLDNFSKESSLPEEFATIDSPNSAECSQNNYHHQFNEDKNLLISIKSPVRIPLRKTNTEKEQIQISNEESIAQMTASLDCTVSLPILNENIKKNIHPEIDNNNYEQCKSIIQQCGQMVNLDDAYAIYSENHVQFVEKLLCVAFNGTLNSRIQTGKMFAQLLLNNFLSSSTIIDGLAVFLRKLKSSESNYTQYLSHIADIIAPLFISKTVFDFSNLRDICDTLSPSEISFLFVQVLRKILNYNEIPNTKKKTGSILELYKMWIKSKIFSFEQFKMDHHINKRFKNHRLGVFLLSLVMCDEIRRTHNDQLFIAIESWIYSTFDSNIIQFPQFMRALTIAIIMVCIDNPVDSLKNVNYIKLLRCFIQLENLTETELKLRKVQCLYGVQIMYAVLDRPKGMLLKMFIKLYSGAVICKESFNIWKEDNKIIDGLDEDLEIKVESIRELDYLFSVL